jgi:glycosyltransferase involved in cell wall biosynthesis
MPSDRLAIAQVSPFAWEVPDEVGSYVSRLADELGRRGHPVVVLAPSQSASLVRESRRAIRAARERPEALLERATPEPLVLGVGEVLPFAPGRRRTASLPVDVARTIEEALTALPLDVVHVHDPFAPSASSAALRHSRALNVGSFHDPTERVLSGQLTRPLARLLFGRLDARTTGSRYAAELMAPYFPADYQVVMPAADPPGPRREPGQVQLALVAEEERAALRAFVRTLRALPDEPDWRATVWSQRPIAPPAGLGRRLRERLRFEHAETLSQPEVFERADIAVFASEGARPAPGALIRAIAAGAVPVCSSLATYEEILADGRYGLVFQPGDVVTLTAHLERLVSDSALRARLSEGAEELRQRLSWTRVADEFEAIYTKLAARRHHVRADPALRARLHKRRLIDVDLHMHTDHSYDCATPVEVLLAEARARGLGAIAVTDHNEVSGAHEARAKADGVKVIVAEEVKTADQGEVIGLFIEEKIERGLTLQDTIAEIKRQGGLVYVPHPFDRLHSVPDYEHLLAVLDDVDAVEVFNPRVAISEFNEEAVRFAAKYRIPAGAGSDAHVPQGLGSVRIRMRDFDGPDEFLQSLRDADIIRNPASLLYVQALKFLQTKALPATARRSSRDRRVRRATGKPARKS